MQNLSAFGYLEFVLSTKTSDIIADQSVFLLAQLGSKLQCSCIRQVSPDARCLRCFISCVKNRSAHHQIIQWRRRKQAKNAMKSVKM